MDNRNMQSYNNHLSENNHDPLSILQINKLKLLKDFILSKQITAFGNETIKTKFDTANTTTEIWYLLFFYELNEIYDDITQQGIYPTSAELNKTYNKSNAWIVLLKNQKKARPILTHLLDLNIFPTSEALSLCSSTDNTNGWYWLTVDKKSLKIFHVLLNQKILPTSEALSLCSTIHNSNGWFWLAVNIITSNVFDVLLDLGIYPTSEALAIRRPDRNTTGWYWLTCYPESIRILLRLLDLKIYPTPSVLELCDSMDNSNGWFWLINHFDKMNIIYKLFKLGIYPTSDALSNCNLTNMINAWFWLVTKERIKVFQDLLNNKIYPTSEALSVIQTSNNLNAWYLLTQGLENIGVLKMLLTLGIYPTSEALSMITTLSNKNGWDGLSTTEDGLKVFQLLISLDIVPNEEFLSETTINSIKTKNGIWNRITALKTLRQSHGFNETTQIVAIMSREDKINFFGYLYLLYLNIEKQQSFFIKEILYLIGQYLLPPSLASLNYLRLFDMLNVKENRMSFIKYFFTDSLDTYSKVYLLNPSTLFYRHRERAISLKDELIITQKDEALTEILKEQFRMGILGMPPSKISHPVKKHECAYENGKVADEKFKEILLDAHFLNAIRPR